MKGKQKILVIVISYQTSHLMQGLIDSVLEQEADINILIVDNASTDLSYNELTLLKDNRVELLRSKENLGFTGGINFALTHASATQQKFDYFFLLNPDAFSTPNLISDLYGIMQKNKNAACVSPKILTLNGTTWYDGALINYNKGIVYNSVGNTHGREKTLHEIDVFSGCAVLFDMHKVMEAGLFNEQLFMYYDEADMSIKLKKLGYKILYTPQLQILHDASYTTRKISFLKTYYMTRNKFMVFNETMSFFTKAYFIVHEFAYHLKYRRFKNAWYHIKGYIDYKKGKYGQFI